MKTNVIKAAFVLIGFFIPFSCTDFLNTTPTDRIPSPTTWTDAALSQAFVYGVYYSLGYGGFEEQMLAVYTDEAMFTHAGRSINVFTEGTEVPASTAWTSPTYSWNNMYYALRPANIAIENLPTSTFPETDMRDQMLGETYFLRAYFYHQLIRYYGGVPIIDKSYGLNEDYTIARSSYEDCVNFILSDLDKAATLLDGKPVVAGRASPLAVLALRARVLLYAASDLHEKSKITPIFDALTPSFTNYELIAYDGGQAARWQAAKVAAKAVIDAGTGYKMNLVAPVSAAEGQANYLALSMGGGSKVADAAAGVELIFQRTQTPLYAAENHWPLGGTHFGINNGPNGYHCWAGNTPIQQLVDDYEMMDGTKFDWNNPTHKADPYANRDPRFYATVLYDGSDWKPRPDDVAGKEPANQIQTGYYEGEDLSGNPIVINGIDTRESSVENWNGSRTHYYCRKFIDPDPSVIENTSGAQVVPWPFFRYTEAVLNYVEACLETNDETEAKLYLNKIRFRAGMPAITETGTALRDRYRNERRLELVYEEHRYHDARRWLIPASTVGRGIKQIKVTAALKAGQTPHNPYYHDKTVYDYTYAVENNTENETRQWNDKMYFRPIARDEMTKNDKLIQNPGYPVETE